MKMDWVVLSCEDTRTLQHQLHSLSVFQLVQLSSLNGLPQRPAHVPRIIESNRWVRREIGREHSRDILLMRLEQREIRREHERDVVHAGSESGPVWALARAVACSGRTVVESQPNCEEQIVVDIFWDWHLSWASEAGCEGCGGGCVIERRHGGHNGRDCGTFGFVLEDGCSGGVVERGALCTGVSPGYDVVSGGGLVSGDEDVGGLARPEHEDVGGEGFDVRGIGPDNCQVVVGDFEEELLVER
ncbi:hypothetical protein CASFOL_023542 [Castilleja foliolosa]|uniref:Uncharacterized protein n=1 Tax=Castilleja foliolosa TaxID=1961234 RepID=A0ABD3CLQ3_9LAMI